MLNRSPFPQLLLLGNAEIGEIRPLMTPRTLQARLYTSSTTWGVGYLHSAACYIYRFDLPGELSVAQIAIWSLARLGPKLLVVTQLKLET